MLHSMRSASRLPSSITLRVRNGRPSYSVSRMKPSAHTRFSSWLASSGWRSRVMGRRRA